MTKRMKNISGFEAFSLNEASGAVNPQRFQDTSNLVMILMHDPEERGKGYEARSIEIVGFYDRESVAIDALAELNKADFVEYVDAWDGRMYVDLSTKTGSFQRYIHSWEPLYEVTNASPTGAYGRWRFEKILTIVREMLKDPNKVDRARNVLATAILSGFDIEGFIDYSELKRIFGGDMSWDERLAKKMRGKEMFGK